MARPCCSECSPYCQTTSVEQFRGSDDELWFGSFEEAPVGTGLHWGEHCCPHCSTCAICQGG